MTQTLQDGTPQEFVENFKSNGSKRASRDYNSQRPADPSTFIEQEPRLAPTAEQEPLRPESCSALQIESEVELQPLKNAPQPMTPVTNQFKEYRITQNQLSSELRELMGQLSERAIHQEVSIAPQDMELVVRSERHTIEIPTKRSKRSTSGRSTSAGKTLDESSRDKLANPKLCF